MASLSSPWVEWTGEYTKAAQAEALPPNEWAARVATAAAAAGERGDVQFSAGLAEMLARVLLSGEGEGNALVVPAWCLMEPAILRIATETMLVRI